MHYTNCDKIKNEITIKNSTAGNLTQTLIFGKEYFT